MVRVWDCRLQVATLAVQIFVMVSVVCTCVWRGSVMGKQHLMAFSWLGEHSAGKRSEFLVFLYNGRKFIRITAFWYMKTVAMFFSSNRALLNSVWAIAMIFPADIALLISWNLPVAVVGHALHCLSHKAALPGLPCLWPSNVQSSQRCSHHKQPAFGSEFQLERLLQQSEVTHSMLLKVLSAGFQFMYNSNIAS